MKKIFCLALALLLIVSAMLLTACGDTVSGSEGSSDTVVPKDTEKENEGAFNLTIEEENGKKVTVGVDEDKDIVSYALIREDNASKNIKSLVAGLRENIKTKTGHSLGIKTTLAGGGKAIVILLDAELGVDDYTITSKSGRIYVKAGSEESLSKAIDVFFTYFVYGTNKSVLVPASKGYLHVIDYAIEKLTIEGVDITEFKVFSDAGNKTGFDIVNVGNEFTDILNASLMEAMGVELELDTYWNEKNHNIIVKANSLDVDPYSIKIEGGDVYISGSYVSAKKALEIFVSDVVGYADGKASKGADVNLTSADNMEGTLGLTVPYTRDELLTMFEEAYENNDMIVTGTHVFDGTYNGSNGTGVAYTEGKFEDKGLDVTAILELEVTKMAAYAENKTTLEQFDLSKLVSESKVHVSKGGIISVCVHLANPFGEDRYINNKWYTGYVGGEEGIRLMITEGTEANKKLRAVMEDTLRLLKVLNDNGIPFMLRPMHEQNADWFWWCILNEGVPADTYVNLWRYFHGVVTKEYGITDVLWVYSPSPNGQNLGTVKVDVMYPYPGDDYVDIVGEDWYTAGELEYNVNKSYDHLMESGKPVGFCEYGPIHGAPLKIDTVDGGYYYDFDGDDIMRDLKAVLANGHKIAYFMTWAWNGSIIMLDKPEVVLNDPIIYTRSDMAEYWKNN